MGLSVGVPGGEEDAKEWKEKAQQLEMKMRLVNEKLQHDTAAFRETEKRLNGSIEALQEKITIKDQEVCTWKYTRTPD